MNSFDQEQLLKKITTTLDQSVEELDGDLQLRLDAIRADALLRPRLELNSDDQIDSLLMAARAALDDSAEELDPAISHQLDEIRRTALSQSWEINGSKPQPPLPLIEKLKAWADIRNLAIPAGAFATTCVLITVVALFYMTPENTLPTDEDVILFASADEIELYENLEFYQWLAENGLPD